VLKLNANIFWLSGGIWELTFKLKLQFLFPFIVCAGMCVLAAVAILGAMPSRRQSQAGTDSEAAVPAEEGGGLADDQEQTPESLGKLATVLVLLANALAAGAWTAMDPTLQLKLLPLGFSAAGVGGFFLLEGVVYTVGAYQFTLLNQYTLYTLHSTLYTLHSTLYTLH